MPGALAVSLSLALPLAQAQSPLLSASVAWQAYVQHAPHLYITAFIALVFKAIVVPVGLHRIIQRLGIHREIETVIGSGTTMLVGMGLVALSMTVIDRKSTRLNSSHRSLSRMPSSA